ncbi:Hsp70 family protein [Emticicia fontis]
MNIGIDIGTSFARACILEDNGKRVAVNIAQEGHRGKPTLLPAVASVFYDQLLIGHEALDNRPKAPEYFISHFKNDLGTNTPYRLGGRNIYPVDIYKSLMQLLKVSAEQQSGGQQIEKTAIAFPADFTEPQKTQLKTAAMLAGLPEITLIAEPIAAAIYDQRLNKLDKDFNFLIFDYGGGTLDLALVSCKSGNFDFICEPSTLPQAGGTELDQLISADIVKKIGRDKLDQITDTNESLAVRIQLEIAALAAQVKQRLSTSQQAEGDLAIGLELFHYQLDRGNFEKLISAQIEETITTLQSYLKSADFNPNKIDRVVLIGGSSLIPLVQQRLSVFLERRVQSYHSQELVIASGALAVITPAQDPAQPVSHDQSANGNGTIETCPVCSGELNPRKNYCGHCGHVRFYPNYILDDMRDEYQQNFKGLIADFTQSSKYNGPELINSTVTRFVKAISAAKHLSRKDAFKEVVTDGRKEMMKDFLERCISGEFHIALIGSIKAGKSTLLNALLKQDLASVNAAPETATLTKFRASGGENYVRISFYSKSDWKEFWKDIENLKYNPFRESFAKAGAKEIENRYIGHVEIFLELKSDEQLKEEIKKWTSAQSKEHFFVKEIEIGLKDFHVPKEVVFVDTPGLDDPVAYRSRITKRYMNRANIVVVCVPAQRLTGPELETIYNAFANTRYNPSKIYILATRYDNFNDPDKDWNDISQGWKNILSKPECFNDAFLAERHLLPVSAYLDILLALYHEKSSKRPPIRAYYKTVLPILESLTGSLDLKLLDDPAIMAQVKDSSNLKAFNQLIEDEIKKSKDLMYQDIAEKYKSLKSQLVPEFGLMRDIHQKKIIDLNAGLEEVLIEQRALQETKRKTKREQNLLEKDLAVFKTGLEDEVDKLIRYIKKNV